MTDIDPDPRVKAAMNEVGAQPGVLVLGFAVVCLLHCHDCGLKCAQEPCRLAACHVTPPHAGASETCRLGAHCNHCCPMCMLLDGLCDLCVEACLQRLVLNT